MEVNKNEEFLFQTLKRIDERTENIDIRMRSVEEKIYNGLSDSSKATELIVNELKIEQNRLREEIKELLLSTHRRRLIGKWVASIVTMCIVAIISIIAKRILGE